MASAIIVPAILIPTVLHVVAENAIFVFFGVMVSDALAPGITLILSAIVKAIIIALPVFPAVSYGFHRVSQTISV
jgi:hypothetical protein